MAIGATGRGLCVLYGVSSQHIRDLAARLKYLEGAFEIVLTIALTDIYRRIINEPCRKVDSCMLTML